MRRMAVFFLLLSLNAFGESLERSGLRRPANNEVKAIRTDNLSFEGEVVEGMNKNPLDSIQSVGDQMFRNGERLFQKKENYRREMKRMLGDMEFTP